MDQDLKAYLEERENRMEARLDERFARLDERFSRIDERFARIDERFTRIDERFEQMDGRFARIDERFGQMDEQFGRVDERFERAETEARHTRVLLEAMHGSIRLLAEGVIATGERIDALQKQTDWKLAEIKSSVDQIHRHLVPRLQLLEEKAARENRDVLEVLRERFGRPQAQ